MSTKTFYILIGLLMCLGSCVKPFKPKIDKYERVIVIDGTLTNDGNSPKVSISYSSNVEDSKIDKVSGAVVYIATSEGQKYYLSEQSEGIYNYTQAMFPVTVGVSYQLVVQHDGNEYKSTMEKLQVSSPITDISHQLKSDNSGINLLISTQEIDSASNYYIWKITETWKFRTPFYSYKRSVNKDVCYATAINELKLGTTELFSKNNFSKYPFLFIPFSSPKLHERYSILVEQFSVSRSTYLYFNHILKTNEAGGSLFDPVPANMNGNITSAQAPVIGNFQVSSVQSKRIYIDRSDLPSNSKISFGMEDCKFESVLMSPQNKRTLDSLENRMTIMDTVQELAGDYVRFTSYVRCFDCTATGHPNTAPTWWVEKN